MKETKDMGNLFNELLYLDEEDLKPLTEEESKPLTEETLAQAAQSRVDGRTPRWYDQDDSNLDEIEQKIRDILEKPIDTDKPGMIEATLDRALDRALWAKDDGRLAEKCVNVLFYGPAGTGKTSRIRKWAKRNHINLVTVLCSTMDDTDMGGAISPDETGTIVKRLASTEFDALGEVENSVLFLDEWNRAPHSVRGTLLTLIQDHTIPDPRQPSHNRYLENFLFTVAAINPKTDDDDDAFNTDQLDQAEQTRFKNVQLLADRENAKNYLLKSTAESYDAEMRRGSSNPAVTQRRLLMLRRRWGIIEALFADPNFDFDTPDEIRQNDINKQTTTARTLTNLLNDCDGTKKDFLDNWDSFCNPKTKYKAENALRGYKDSNAKANSVFKKESRGFLDLLDYL